MHITKNIENKIKTKCELLNEILTQKKNKRNEGRKKKEKGRKGGRGRRERKTNFKQKFPLQNVVSHWAHSSGAERLPGIYEALSSSPTC